MLKLSYGRYTFASRPGVHTLAGTAILKDGLSGWWSRPTARTEDQDRPGQHGVFEQPTYLTSRLVTAVLYMESRDPRRVRHTASLLSGMPARARLAVDEDGHIEWADAELLEVTPVRPQLTGGNTVTVMWRCPNPRKFGQLHEFVSDGSAAHLEHGGTFGATPVFRVQGFSQGYRITGLGAQAGNYFTVAGPKVWGTVDEIDFSNGMLTRDGVPVTRAILQNHVWDVKPGTAGADFRVDPLDSAGTGTVRAFVTDTFV